VILSIDTSTPACAVALCQNGRLLGTSELFLEKATASSCLPLVHQLLESCQASPRQLQAVAVAHGPGSYTGLRIGLSTAKGLCMALGLPLYGIGTLEALAAEAAYRLPIAPHDWVMPLLDARRLEAYAALYDAQGHEAKAPHSCLLDRPEAFADVPPQGRVWVVGDAAVKAIPFLPGDRFLPVPHLHTAAAGAALLAAKRLESGSPDSLAYAEPFYLKPAQAKASEGHKLLKTLKQRPS
jgi:tRNA threonylcarbamoyladenosine biosynthesis protein TsaB